MRTVARRRPAQAKRNATTSIPSAARGRGAGLARRLESRDAGLGVAHATSGTPGLQPGQLGLVLPQDVVHGAHGHGEGAQREGGVGVASMELDEVGSPAVQPLDLIHQVTDVVAGHGQPRRLVHPQDDAGHRELVDQPLERVPLAPQQLGQRLQPVAPRVVHA